MALVNKNLIYDLLDDLEDIDGDLRVSKLIDEYTSELVELNKEDTLELLADFQHQIWVHWMKYQFSQGIENENGSLTIPSEKVIRWKQQMNTDYNDLTEKEKESDSNQVRKFLHLMEKCL